MGGTRQCLLLRHAKSSRDEPALEDHDRPLTKRGRRQAATIADYLARAGAAPDLVLCSTALRARATLEPILAAIKPRRILFDRDLYLVPASALLRHLRGISDSDRSVLLIGHNPGIHELALMLADAGSLAALPPPGGKFPTGTLVQFSIPVAWRRLAPQSAHVAAYVTPRDLADDG